MIVLCVCFALVLCFSVLFLRFLTLERDKPLDYVSVLFQFTFAATTALAPVRIK